MNLNSFVMETGVIKSNMFTWLAASLIGSFFGIPGVRAETCATLFSQGSPEGREKIYGNREGLGAIFEGYGKILANHGPLSKEEEIQEASAMADAARQGIALVLRRANGPDLVRRSIIEIWKVVAELQKSEDRNALEHIRFHPLKQLISRIEDPASAPLEESDAAGIAQAVGLAGQRSAMMSTLVKLGGGTLGEEFNKVLELYREHREKLWYSTFRLVFHKVKKIYVSIDQLSAIDLFEKGLFGSLVAVETYLPGKGTRLGSYVGRRIKWELDSEINTMQGVGIAVSTATRYRSLVILKEAEALSDEGAPRESLGDIARIRAAQLSGGTGRVELSAVRRWILLSRSHSSLDQVPAGMDPKARNVLGRLIPDRRAEGGLAGAIREEGIAAQDPMIERMREILFPEEVTTVLALFGLPPYNQPLNLRETAELLPRNERGNYVTPERVRQRRDSALKKLREDSVFIQLLEAVIESRPEVYQGVAERLGLTGS